MLRKTTLFLSILLLMGCAQIAQELDSTWADNKTVYRKSATLPLLDIPSTLAKEGNKPNETQ